MKLVSILYANSQLLTLISLFLLANSLFAQDLEKSTFKEINNLRYVEGARIQDDSLQRLNLVLPKGTKSAPLLIWIGGGAWSYGDRHQEMHLARKLAENGIAVASTGHRMSPAIWRDSTLNKGVQHPAHIKDIAAATKWLYAHAAAYGYSTDKFFIGGFSSGAHLATLLDLNPAYLQAEGLVSGLFKGVISISGTYDIVNYHNVMSEGSRPELAILHVEAVFGQGEAVFRNASPINYLKNLKTPILLISDANMYNYARLFEDRIRETNFRNILSVYVQDLSHGPLWKNLSFAKDSGYRNLIIDFIYKNSKVPNLD